MHSGVEFYCSLSMLFLCVLYVLHSVQPCFYERGSKEKRPFESCCVLTKATQLKKNKGWHKCELQKSAVQAFLMTYPWCGLGVVIFSCLVFSINC